METEPPTQSLRSNISQLLQAIFNTAGKTITLAALESRIAGMSLLSIIGLLFVSSLLVFAAWLTLLAVAVIWLASLHITLLNALLIIAVFNLALLIPIGFLVKHYFQKLLFPATRRQLHASKIQIAG